MLQTTNQPKIALIHDYLTQFGGAEKVIESIHELHPWAPLYTAIYNPTSLNNAFSDWDIRTSFLQNFPGAKNHTRLFLPFLPAAFESFNLKNFDLVISSASAFAKGVITHPGTKHICYCHTPTRYLWSDADRYIKEVALPWPANKIAPYLMPYALQYYRLWDYRAAQRPDILIANSKTVQDRIKKYYNRDSIIIYPPVQVNNFTVRKTNDIKDYYLVISRLMPYKRVDLVIKAFNRLRLPLIVVGTGEDAPLKALAKNNITFTGWVGEDKKKELLQGARALIFPQEEDFGITAVEALASGVPVIAYSQGGATEIIEEGKSGLFFHEQIWEELADKVARFQFIYKNFDPQVCRARAEIFSEERFKNELSSLINQTLNS